MIRGYKIRLYPTKEQEQLMWKHIGCCRYVWNYMLELQEERYKNGEKHLTGCDMGNQITKLKHDGDHDWLNDVSYRSLSYVTRDIYESYKRFYKGIARVPKFKSKKRAKMAFPTRENISFDGRTVCVERIGKIKYKTDFDLPIGKNVAKFSNPRISYKNGKWTLGFAMECENQAPVLTDQTMGIDLGIKDLAVAELNGEKIVFHNINKSKKIKYLKNQLKHTQRTISRKYEANKVENKYVKTNNILHSEDKLRKLHARIANIRHNYIHQTTHALISRFPKRIVMEDLCVSDMRKNKHLSKYIQEQCLYDFLQKMKYKCEWNGIEFVQVDRYYPSSKTCSQCGHVKKNFKLSDRTYVCDECGLVIDRDYNAAINLSKYTG